MIFSNKMLSKGVARASNTGPFRLLIQQASADNSGESLVHTRKRHPD